MEEIVITYQLCKRNFSNYVYIPEKYKKDNFISLKHKDYLINFKVLSFHEKRTSG